VIGTDWTGSCKFNYHTITATTAPIYLNRTEYPQLKLKATLQLSCLIHEMVLIS
jgi:hypothetical protein